ncbi:membrane protein [Catalinimonas alkaloidigena]|uniref:Membrane protein n=1 Tax=Catalinimonas alkaloidigena TaxID=1075417 RepID=A0A1G9JEG9_9BACT|nr:YihY/virulence factor BrkB family protein [Catalinimonas alkaloidigena]SDL35969.1 membrane protein [Catalinimonas alkaloidigena]
MSKRKILIRRGKGAWAFVQEMYEEWINDNCFKLAAALSYYTIFSLPPIIIIVIYSAGTVYGRDAFSGEIFDNLSALIGDEAALGVQKIVENAYLEESKFIPRLIGVGTLVFSATILFATVQDSLNLIWGVRAKPERGFLYFLISRVLSFAMVLACGALLLLFLVFNTLLVAFRNLIEDVIKGYSVYLLEGMQYVLTFAILTLVFAAMFKFLPDVRLKWRFVWRGAILTSVLFSIGKSLISIYLGQSDYDSTYGATASMVILILWVNYSAWIFFIGAEFIYVYMRRRGEYIVPAKNAVRVVRQEIEDPSRYEEALIAGTRSKHEDDEDFSTE